jgi:hypothetical protein
MSERTEPAPTAAEPRGSRRERRERHERMREAGRA